MRGMNTRITGVAERTVASAEAFRESTSTLAFAGPFIFVNRFTQRRDDHTAARTKNLGTRTTVGKVSAERTKNALPKGATKVFGAQLAWRRPGEKEPLEMIAFHVLDP